MSILNNLNPQFNPLGQMPQLPAMMPQARTPQQMQMYNQLLQNIPAPPVSSYGAGYNNVTPVADSRPRTGVANTSIQMEAPLSDSTILYNPVDPVAMGGPQGGYDGGGINPVIGPNI